MRMTRHPPSTTKLIRVDKHGIKTPAMPNAGGRRRQSTSRSEFQSQTESQSQARSRSRLSQNEEGVSILVKKGIGRTLVKSGQKAGRKPIGGSQANGFADRMRISRGVLARSDGIPRGDGEWPFKGPNTRKGRLVSVLRSVPFGTHCCESWRSADGGRVARGHMYRGESHGLSIIGLFLSDERCLL
jgi:hypothetical protein